VNDWVKFSCDVGARGLLLRYACDPEASSEMFFDDTQLEVSGRSFEGAQLNYHGDWALSWQPLWLGPFLVDGELDSPGDVEA